MFVSLERLNFCPTKIPTAQTTKVTLPQQVRSRLDKWINNEDKSQNTPGGRANNSQRPTASTRSQGHKNSGSRFHKGDRVVTHNKDQVPIHGTVRWTRDSGKVNVVGIETVSDIL